MRITFINRLAGIQWGGGETFDLETARALRSLGHEVRFLIGRRWSRLDRPLEEFPAIVVRSPYLRGWMYRSEAYAWRPLRRLGCMAMRADLDLFERAALPAVTRHDLGRWTEVFQINGLPRLGALLRHRLGTVTTIVWHGPPEPCERRWNEACSATFAFGDSLDAVRRNADPRAREILPGVDPFRFRPLHDPDGRRALRRKHEIPEEAIVCLFVGRMIPVKGLPLLLRAFAAAHSHEPRLFLLLVGDGPVRGELRAQAAALQVEDSVRFAGRREGEDLVEHYNLADVFALTSSYENFPFVVLEAMACGLPVIATRVGGLVRMVVEGETGSLAEGGNEGRLAGAILELAGDAGRRRALGEAGRRRIEQEFRWEDTARRMVDLYQACLDGRP